MNDRRVTYVVVEGETDVADAVATQLIEFAFVAPLQALEREVRSLIEMEGGVHSPVRLEVRTGRFSIFLPLSRSLRRESKRRL